MGGPDFLEVVHDGLSRHDGLVDLDGLGDFNRDWGDVLDEAATHVEDIHHLVDGACEHTQ